MKRSGFLRLLGVVPVVFKGIVFGQVPCEPVFRSDPITDIHDWVILMKNRGLTPDTLVMSDETWQKLQAHLPTRFDSDARGDALMGMKVELTPRPLSFLESVSEHNHYGKIHAVVNRPRN